MDNNHRVSAASKVYEHPGQELEFPRARKCSKCRNEGHNSRTCNVRGPTDLCTDDLQLDLTLGNGWPEVSSVSQSQAQGSAADNLPSPHPNNHRNQGMRWSREEHLGFLRGLKVLGKGSWIAMSRDFVPTRTPNQVSSHSQKYFKRVKDPLRIKRNPSIFDVGRDDDSDPCCCFSRKQPLPRVGCRHLLVQSEDKQLHHQPEFETRLTLDLLSNINRSDDEVEASSQPEES